MALEISTVENKEAKGKRLSDVLFQVQSVLRNGFAGGVWIIAEVANLNSRRGHVYLELTETNEQGQTLASCRAMIWKSQAESLLARFVTETGSELQPGQKILILAEVSFHNQYGFSLVIQDLDPSYSLGELEQRLNQIRQNLIKKGIYANNKQFVLPTDFFRVAVIAPPEAAGLGDFRADADVLQQLGLCEFKYFYSSFQGNAVETELLSALDAVESLHQAKPYDALVIIRGGGAKLDLNMLNLEPVAEKVCQMPLAVISGIGHERDNTIIDEVANTRHDTPSKVIGFIKNQITHQAKQAQNNWLAIEKSSRIKVEQLHNAIIKLHHQVTQNSQNMTYQWQKKLEPMHHQIQVLSSSKLNKVAQSIESLNQHIQSASMQKVEKNADEIEQLNSSIRENVSRALEFQKQQIIQNISFVLSSGPKVQLNRGFSIVKTLTGEPITNTEKAVAAKHIEVEFADGSVLADITAKKIES